jgi:3-deoxy-D-manno-octulosonic acid kinase
LGPVDVVAQADAVAMITERFKSADSLYDAAAKDPASEHMEGRRRVYFLPVGDNRRWVIRRLHHGGVLAGLTRDLFWRGGTPRPLNELLLAAALRTEGINTPSVVAACVYPRGCFYRGEVAREEIRHAVDLARFLFDPQRQDSLRRAALHATGVLVRRLHDVGIHHPDLNLRNILVSYERDALQTHVIDLEKCRRRPRLSSRERHRMLARLRHSARRFAAYSGIRLAAADWEEFQRGYGEVALDAG